MHFQSNSVYKTIMNKLKLLLLRHPTRTKYVLLFLDIFFILIATKMFINYNSIELAIEESNKESQLKEEQLAFAQNFQLNYQKSDYAQRFLKHENNMLRPGEFIIKFQALSKVVESWTQNQTGRREHILSTPQESRQLFFSERLFKSN